MATLDVIGRRNGKNNQVVDQVIVDDELLPELKKYTWSGTPEGYAFRSLPNGGGLQYLHYFVWEHCHGVDDVPEDMFLDHKNQNKRDNQIANLQVVNDRVKNANAPKRSDNTSGSRTYLHYRTDASPQMFGETPSLFMVEVTQLRWRQPTPSISCTNGSTRKSKPRPISLPRMH